MNYKETNLTGTSWTRCKNITVTNPLANDPTPRPAVQRAPVPTAFFYEEIITQLSDNSISKRDLEYCSIEFDPSGLINIIDVTTGIPTGEAISHNKLYTILYSLYMQVAQARDASQ